MGSVLFRFGISLVIFFSFNLSAMAAGYKDVPKAHWARPDVIKIVDEYQFMSGDPNGNFGGSRALTRYEFAKVMSRMIEYYNQEIETDRKDLENMVSVLELFQGQVKKLETKLGTAGDSVGDQNKTLEELNEMVIALAEEVNNIDTTKPESVSKEELAALSNRVANAEENIHKLSEKGLFVDTLVKGSFYDVKHLGEAVGRLIDRHKSEELDTAANAVETETQTQVDANLKTTATQTSTPTIVAPSNTYTKEIEEFTKTIQTNKGGSSETLEYIAPLEEKK